MAEPTILRELSPHPRIVRFGRVKTPLIYGIGITFVNAVFTLLFHLLGYSTSAEKFGTYMIVGSLCGIAVLVIGIVLGTRQARTERIAGGANPFRSSGEIERGDAGFSYGQAFKTGLLIAVCAAITGTVFQFIYFKFLNPEFVEVTIEWTRGLMENMGAREADIARMVEDMRAKSTIGRQLINAVVFTVITGTVISLITAAILKRPPADAPRELPPTLA